MTTSEKVAYLKGLCEGLGVDSKSKEGKIYTAILDVLSSLASDVEDIEANAAATADAVNDISEDLSHVEDFIDGFEDGDDDEDYDDDLDECDYNCSECGACDAVDDDDDEIGGDDEEENEELDLDDTQMYEVTCPNCGDTVTVDESILALGSIECPGCGKILEFDMDAKDED
jgi:DNA-directed RNA polymerase subunit RPC12/RpoP